MARPSMAAAVRVSGQGSGLCATFGSSHFRQLVQKRANKAFLWFPHQLPILGMLHDFRALAFVIASWQMAIPGKVPRLGLGESKDIGETLAASDQARLRALDEMLGGVAH